MKWFNFLRSKRKAKPETFDVSFAYPKIITPGKFLYTATTSLQNVLDLIKANSSALGIYLTAGASDDDIAEFEQSTTFLPEDFKTLYRLSNGFETDHDLFRLIPLKEISRNRKDSYLISDTSFHFTEYMIYCDRWSVNVNVENTNSYMIYNKGKKTVFLTNALAEFLAVFINKGIYDGLYQWQDDMQKKLPK